MSQVQNPSGALLTGNSMLSSGNGCRRTSPPKPIPQIRYDDKHSSDHHKPAQQPAPRDGRVWRDFYLCPTGGCGMRK
jgi:hypothetical protein